MFEKVSYAQQGEDIRVWRAFRDHDQATLRYVDVGANEPRHLSITASLSDLGWRGLLIEADADLARELRALRPRDAVVEMAAAGGPGELTFFRVPGTGLGTLDAAEAEAARKRGFAVETVTVPTDTLDAILERVMETDPALTDLHFMSIDVEGAEAAVISGLSLKTHRPWVLCIEAVLPGTDTPSHGAWEPMLLAAGYAFATFDGVNRWYVADEHADLAPMIATPFNAIDAGAFGWIIADSARERQHSDRAYARRAWQRELIGNDLRGSVPTEQYEQRIAELEQALALVQVSRSWRYARKVGGAARRAKHLARVGVTKLPRPIHKRVVRARHLRHVQANFPELTNPAYLGADVDATVVWHNPESKPELPRRGLAFEKLTIGDFVALLDWLDAGPYDDDATLETRIDNLNDELGRVKAALRTRARVASVPGVLRRAVGDKVLVDARSLQTAAFATRGIGRFAGAALRGVRETLGDEHVVLLVDHGLEPLPDDLVGGCEQVIRVSVDDVARFGALIEPSPMTASVDPLIPLLHSNAHKIAVVYDFIPMHYPSIYLKHAAERAEYAAALDALRLYDEYACISELARTELLAFLHDPIKEKDELSEPEDIVDDAPATYVAWPESVGVTRGLRPGETSGPIVVMTGDEPRKNTYGALAAIGAATAGDHTRDVLVIGMAGQEVRVHHWSIHAAMRPGEATTLGRISDAEMHEILRTASLVVVPSFDEGLSLPIIEAVNAGSAVIASDIPAHRELIGRGDFLFDPKDLSDAVRAVRKHLRNEGAYSAQHARLARHAHCALEDALGEHVAEHLFGVIGAIDAVDEGPTTEQGTAVLSTEPAAATAPASEAEPAAAVEVAERMRVAFATPWVQQRTGVADFSTAIGRELARMCDLTVFTTSGAEPDPILDLGITFRPIEDVFADPAGVAGMHDVFVVVLGNSHFHLPFLDVMKQIDTVAVLHDTRMVELYLALRGPGGVQELMLRGTGERALRPSLDEQIADMRLLQNAGLWEAAQRSTAMIMHTETAAQMVADQTGRRPHLLPFANQRVPKGAVDVAARSAARARLGWDDGRIHLGSFGFVDVRTKQADLVVEAAAWLRQWGHDVALHMIGSAMPGLHDQLIERAGRAGLHADAFEITGFVSESEFRDYLLAVDLGVQLRVSPLLGVSGPLSDLSAWGTPAVASRGLATDIGAPSYVTRLPDEASPLMVAEAVERALAANADDSVKARETERQAYLASKAPRLYAERMLDVLVEVTR